MNALISIYIPDDSLRGAVARAVQFLNLAVRVQDQGTGDQDIILESVTPLRLGAVMDWLTVRAATQMRSIIQTPILLAVGQIYVADRLFMGSGTVPIRLTDREMDMICALYHAQGHTMQKAELLDQVWGYAAGAETHTIETHIYRLRQKIERDPSVPENILTTDVGYRLIVQNKD